MKICRLREGAENRRLQPFEKVERVSPSQPSQSEFTCREHQQASDEERASASCQRLNPPPLHLSIPIGNAYPLTAMNPEQMQSEIGSHPRRKDFCTSPVALEADRPRSRLEPGHGQPQLAQDGTDNGFCYRNGRLRSFTASRGGHYKLQDSALCPFILARSFARKRRCSDMPGV